MEQSKSPKALAYANLGKRQTSKNPSDQLRKPKRDSTGIYEELLDQIPQEANNYIRDLVKQNEKESNEAQANHNNHSRRKSYAEIVIDSASKQKEKERVREERETLGKAKFAVLEDTFLEQVTPKNGTLPLNKRSNKNGNSMSSLSQSANIMVNSFKKQPVKATESFLDHLSNYLYQLNETHEVHGNTNFNKTEKLSETLKINSGQNESFKLISKLDQSHLKIKQLKLKNYYQQKQIKKFAKKQQKMLHSLQDIIGEMKHLNAQLSYQKQERKKLERIIDSFQMRRNQPQRKTIGKHHINIERLNDMHTEYEHENDFDSSFIENRKNSTNKRANAIKIYDQARNRGFQGMLDSQKISKLFRSNYNSDQSDN